MSCRRSDRINLKGCRIGDVAMRGCSRGCCPYPDDKISENIRHHLTNHFPPSHIERTTKHPSGRTGLYYDKCQSYYRPKLICAKKNCRRSIKPVYNPDQNEYRISETQGWEVRPLKETNKEFAKACKNAKRIDSSSDSVKAATDSDWKKRQVVIEKFGRVWAWKNYGEHFGDVENEEDIKEWELDFLKKNDPESWWLEFILLPAGYNPKGVNHKRCSGCGDEALLVGPNFRIPARKDNKAWRKVEVMVETGEDMLAKFSPCPTVNQHKEMVEEAIRLRRRAQATVQWAEEKKARIAAGNLTLQKSI